MKATYHNTSCFLSHLSDNLNNEQAIMKKMLIYYFPVRKFTLSRYRCCGGQWGGVGRDVHHVIIALSLICERVFSASYIFSLFIHLKSLNANTDSAALVLEHQHYSCKELILSSCWQISCWHCLGSIHLFTKQNIRYMMWCQAFSASHFPEISVFETISVSTYEFVCKNCRRSEMLMENG